MDNGVPAADVSDGEPQSDGEGDSDSDDSSSSSSDEMEITGGDIMPKAGSKPKTSSPEPAPFVFASRKAGPSTVKRNGPAWVDPSDANVQVSLAKDKRLRKLRDGPEDDVVSGKQYESKLREQYVAWCPILFDMPLTVYLKVRADQSCTVMDYGGSRKASYRWSQTWKTEVARRLVSIF